MKKDLFELAVLVLLIFGLFVMNDSLDRSSDRIRELEKQAVQRGYAVNDDKGFRWINKGNEPAPPRLADDPWAEVVERAEKVRQQEDELRETLAELRRVWEEIGEKSRRISESSQ